MRGSSALEVPEDRDLMVLDVLERLKAPRIRVHFLPALLPGRCMRLRWHQHERPQRARVHHARSPRPHQTRQARVASAARSARHPRPGRGHEPVLSNNTRKMQAVSDQRQAAAGSARGCRSPEERAAARTVSTSASFARAAPRPARRSGGIRTNSSVRQGCCRRIDFSRTVAIRQRRNALSRPRRSVQRVSMPRHHELCERLSEADSTPHAPSVRSGQCFSSKAPDAHCCRTATTRDGEPHGRNAS